MKAEELRQITEAGLRSLSEQAPNARIIVAMEDQVSGAYYVSWGGSAKLSGPALVGLAELAAEYVRDVVRASRMSPVPSSGGDGILAADE